LITILCTPETACLAHALHKEEEQMEAAGSEAFDRVPGVNVSGGCLMINMDDAGARENPNRGGRPTPHLQDPSSRNLMSSASRKMRDACLFLSTPETISRSTNSQRRERLHLIGAGALPERYRAGCSEGPRTKRMICWKIEKTAKQ
jgi:hypothetical protein